MSAKTEKHTCEKTIYRRFFTGSSHLHGVGAKYEHEGKWYCKTHHPPTAKAKYAEQTRKWQAEQDAKDTARDKTAGIRKAEQRVLAAAWSCADVDSGQLNDAVNALTALGWEPES